MPTESVDQNILRRTGLAQGSTQLIWLAVQIKLPALKKKLIPCIIFFDLAISLLFGHSLRPCEPCEPSCLNSAALCTPSTGLCR